MTFEKRTTMMIMTISILSVALLATFGYSHSEEKITSQQTIIPSFSAAEAELSGVHHDIEMEAVKMPDGMYAYRIVSYERDGTDLVEAGIYDRDPSIPGPTLVFNEGDTVDLNLYNNACDSNFVDGGVGFAENSLVGIHVHGVHYDITDDATYMRVNMAENSAATCGDDTDYHWDIGLGTAGTGPTMITPFQKMKLAVRI